MRLFVALAPPDSALDDLEAAWTPLRSGRDDLRWTNREAWHVTLAFLGEVSEDVVVRLAPRLERAARRHRVFPLAFAGSGAFPRPERANVLWCGLSGDHKALGELAASVGAGARRAGALPPDEGRKYRPHLTLARCRAPSDVTGLVERLSGYHGESWPAREIYLINSRLRERPRYEILGRWPLRPDSASPGSEPRPAAQLAPPD